MLRRGRIIGVTMNYSKEDFIRERDEITNIQAALAYLVMDIRANINMDAFKETEYKHINDSLNRFIYNFSRNLQRLEKIAEFLNFASWDDPDVYLQREEWNKKKKK